MDGAQTLAGDAEVALGAAAALGGGFTEVRGDEALGLEAIECGVDAADGDVAAALLGELSGERDAVGFISETKDGEEKREFELAEIGVLAHIFNICEEIVVAQCFCCEFGGSGAVAD
jgi:hypothetical protein